MQNNEQQKANSQTHKTTSNTGGFRKKGSISEGAVKRPKTK